MRVAILGTGKMGGAMARRLSKAGHDLVLWNRERSSAEALSLGQVTATPAEAAAQAEVVISSVTNADAVRSVYLGENGAAKAARDQVFVEMSTTGGDINKELASVLERSGAQFVEAPIVGSWPAVESGTALILAAGKPEAINRAHDVIAAFGEVRVIGDLGRAATLKLVANTMLGGISSLAAELLAAGVGAGVKAEDVFFVLNRMAPVLNARKAYYLDHRYEPTLFAVRDIVKDLNLANELYRRVGASTPLAAMTKQLYDRVADSAADLDITAIASLYEQQPAARRS
jgi:3-hydroxyisobutyrate dehydrogenase-like beta-hydroxyacid dehydrogenase